MFSRVTGSSPDRTPAVRVLVVGNSGSGKTSLANLIVHDTPLRLARPTVGCNTYVTTVGGPEDGLSHGLLRQTFVELWDIGAHERYRALRSSFYVDVGGVIIVTEGADGRRRQASMRKWAAEVAGRAKFASALLPDQAAANPGSLPVPCLIINNKADLRGKGGRRGTWRQGLLTWLSTLLQQFKFRRRLELLMRPSSSSGLQAEDRISVTTINASATQGVLDRAAVSSFFCECAALRLSGGLGAGSVARAPVRRSAVQGAYPGAAPKPLLMHSPGHGSGPPLPSHMPYTSQMESGGPASTSSWGGFSGGFSRTTSFHSTISSSSDHAHAWEQAPGQRPGMADAGQHVNAGDDSADLV